MQVGIVRLGNIGSEVLNRLQAVGFIISYNSRKRQSVLFPYCANVYDLAVNSDVLVVCCALTEQTHHIINKDVMAELGKGGMIINVGRGTLVDEKEMLQFLVQGEINGVGLDVFENDPNVPKEPLRLDNIVPLPCQNAFDSLGELIVYNLKVFFSNKPLRHRSSLTEGIIHLIHVMVSAEIIILKHQHLVPGREIRVMSKNCLNELLQKLKLEKKLQV